MRWSDVRYFTPDEFSSPDAPGSGERMDLAFVAKLDALRKACGFPLTVNSGFRTEAHNARVGGVDSSSHTSGHAADIKVRSSQERHRVLTEAMRLGFNRVGIAKTFIHLDDSPEHPGNVVWVY